LRSVSFYESFGKAFEASGIQPFYEKKEDAISYAPFRVCERAVCIRTYAVDGALEQTIPADY